MASSIIATTIDETFPVAGIDNDSQGFRDNFTIIKDNFTYAKSEIEALQDNTAKVNTDNSFDNNTISLANLKESTKEFNDSATGGSGDITLSFSGGHFYAIDDVASGTMTITLDDWPNTDQYAEIIIELKPATSDPTNVTFASKNPSGTASIYNVDDNAAWSGRTITLDNATSVKDVVKAWTYNGGLSVYFNYIGRFSVSA